MGKVASRKIREGGVVKLGGEVRIGRTFSSGNMTNGKHPAPLHLLPISSRSTDHLAVPLPADLPVPSSSLLRFPISATSNHLTKDQPVWFEIQVDEVALSTRLTRDCSHILIIGLAHTFGTRQLFNLGTENEGLGISDLQEAFRTR
jgi:hypothetical protein